MQFLKVFLVLTGSLPHLRPEWLEQARNIATVIAAGVALIGVIPLFINLWWFVRTS